MRKAFAFVLMIATSVLGVPMNGVAAEVKAKQDPKAGTISGKVTDITPGQDITVQLRNAAGDLVGQPVTPDAAGNFTFGGLPPGTYTVQVVSGTQVVPLTVTVAAGQVASVTLSAAALSAALAAAAATGGIVGFITSTAGIVTLAGVAVGAVAIRAATNDASPSR